MVEHELGGRFMIVEMVCAEVFVTEFGLFFGVVFDLIVEEIGVFVRLSTLGGMFDVCFIKDYCLVFEFGLINVTIH